MTENGGPIGEGDLQAFVDGRLAGERLAAVEAYLALHPEVVERVAIEQRHRVTLRAQLDAKFAEPIPARLSIANILTVRRSRRTGRARLAVAAIAIFVVGASGGWFANRLQLFAPWAAPAPATTTVAQGATAAYRTFVVEVAHPVEVGAAQEAHLLQWLSKRLGKPLTAPELMYDDASGKRLTIYVRAADGSETAFRFQQEGDASTFAWIDQGFGFAVTAMANRDELLPIAEAVYRGFVGVGDVGGQRKG